MEASMSKSVTLTFGEPELPPPPAPAPSRPADPAALTRDERTSANWQVKFIGWVVGLPSLIAIGFVAAVEQRHAWIFTADPQTWLAESAGLLAIALFGAGLPIAWGLTRDTQPTAAKAAFWFWLACVAMNFAIMAGFAWHDPEIRAAPPAIARDMPGDVAYELDGEIAWRREALADADGHQGHFDADARAWYASTSAELRRLETKRYGTTITGVAAPKPGQRPGLDMAGVALLMIAGSAVGLAISASSLAAILTEKAATVRLEAEAAPLPARSEPTPAGAYHPGESADGFDHWALASVSRLQGRQIRTAEAHLHYQTFCARNDYLTPLAIQEFGRRFRAWLMDTYGIDGRHSNGTVFDGVTLAPLGHALAAPAMNGAA
jgi:hypothetical protein